MKKKVLKVLQVNVVGATFSTGRTTRELHDYLTAHGHKSLIAIPRARDCDDAFVYASRIEEHFDILFSILTGYEATASILPTRRLIRYMEQEEPDVVHLRNLHSYSLNIRMLLQYLGEKDIPTVITLHDCWFMTGLCPHYTLQKCDRWKTGCHSCPHLYMSGSKLLFDRTNTMWKNKRDALTSIPRLAVVGVSDWVTNEAQKSFLGSAKILKRIYNWIDLETFTPKNDLHLRENLRLQGKKVILGVAAGWRSNSRKGLDVFLQLAEILPGNYVIVLVGSMIYDGALPKNIISVGATNNATELAEYYSMADVFLNLSKEETFGKVSAEAVSCGTPVVAVDSTANRELVPPGGGIVLENDAVENIKSAVIEVAMRGKEKYQQVCRKFAEKNFDMKKNIDENIDVYYELLNLRKEL